MAWNIKGTIYMRLDKKEEAIRSFEKTLELDPQNSKAIEMLKELRGKS